MVGALSYGSDQAVRVRALDRDSSVVFFTLAVPLFTQVYKWVRVNVMLGLTLWWSSISSREEKKYF